MESILRMFAVSCAFLLLLFFNHYLFYKSCTLDLQITVLMQLTLIFWEACTAEIRAYEIKHGQINWSPASVNR